MLDVVDAARSAGDLKINVRPWSALRFGVVAEAACGGHLFILVLVEAAWGPDPFGQAVAPPPSLLRSRPSTIIILC